MAAGKRPLSQEKVQRKYSHVPGKVGQGKRAAEPFCLEITQCACMTCCCWQSRDGLRCAKTGAHGDDRGPLFAVAPPVPEPPTSARSCTTSRSSAARRADAPAPAVCSAGAASSCVRARASSACAPERFGVQMPMPPFIPYYASSHASNFKCMTERDSPKAAGPPFEPLEPNCLACLEHAKT